MTDHDAGHWSTDERFAAWPLDLDTIILTDSEASPFMQMLSKATAEQKWQGNDSCDDCTSREICPFYANAEMLRDEKTLETLLLLLRRGEMATGQRWNFRDAFSLCAELIVGQRDDFEQQDREGSPCSWVHERADGNLFWCSALKEAIGCMGTGISSLLAIPVPCMA